MQLEPWLPPCVLFGWWFSPWELLGVWLVDIVVLPVGLQTPSASSVLSLTHPLRSLCSDVSICLCICKALAWPLRRQAPFSKHFLASTIEYVRWIPRWGSLWMAFPSVSALCLRISSLEYFVPPSKKDQNTHTLVVLLLELHVVYELYLGYLELLD